MESISNNVNFAANQDEIEFPIENKNLLDLEMEDQVTTVAKESKEMNSFKVKLVKLIWKFRSEGYLKEGIKENISIKALSLLCSILCKPQFGKEMAKYLKKAIISIGHGFSVYSNVTFINLLFDRLKNLSGFDLEKQISFFNPNLKTFKELINHLENNYCITSSILISLLDLKKHMCIIAEDLVRNTVEEEEDLNEMLNKFDEQDEQVKRMAVENNEQQLEQVANENNLDETLSTEKSNDNSISTISTLVSRHERNRLDLIIEFSSKFKRASSDEESYRKVFSMLMLNFNGKSYFDVVRKSLDLFKKTVFHGELKITHGMLEFIIATLLETEVDEVEQEIFFSMFSSVIKSQYLSQEHFLDEDSIFYLLEIINRYTKHNLCSEGFTLFYEIFICINTSTNNLKIFNRKITQIQDFENLTGMKILFEIYLTNPNFIPEAKNLILNIIAVVSASPGNLESIYELLFGIIKTCIENNEVEKIKRMLKILKETKEVKQSQSEKVKVVGLSHVTGSKGSRNTTLPLDTTISELKIIFKELFDDNCEIPMPDPKYIQMLYSGRLLRDNQTLADIKFKDEGKIIIMEGVNSELEVDDDTMEAMIIQVQMILSEVSGEIIKVALKKCGYNNEMTIMYLLDPENVEKVKQEIEEENKVNVKETVAMLTQDRLLLLLSLTPSSDIEVEEIVWEIISNNTLPLGLVESLVRCNVIYDALGDTTNTSQTRVVLMIYDNLIFGEKTLKNLPELTSIEKSEKKAAFATVENIAFLVDLLSENLKNVKISCIIFKWLKEFLFVSHYLVYKEKIEIILRIVNSRTEKVIDFSKEFKDDSSKASDSNKTPRFGNSVDTSFDEDKKKKARFVFEGEFIDCYLDDAVANDVINNFINFGWLNTIFNGLNFIHIFVNSADVLMLFFETNNAIFENACELIETNIIENFKNETKLIRKTTENLLSVLFSKISPENKLVKQLLTALKGEEEFNDEFYALIGKILSSPKGKEFEFDDIFKVCINYRGDKVSNPKRAGYLYILNIIIKVLSKTGNLEQSIIIDLTTDLLTSLFEITKSTERKFFYEYAFSDQNVRSKAYALLTTLIKLYPVSLKLVLEKLNTSFVFDSAGPEDVICSQETTNQPLLGFHNYACTCYINSLLQQLEKLSKFKEIIFGSQENDLLREMSLEFHKLRHSQYGQVYPLAFIKSIKLPGDEEINLMQQQDAEEFMNILFQKLEDSLPEVEKNKMINLFSMVAGSETISLEEKLPYYSLRKEHNFTLNIDIKNKKNLQESLSSYTRGEVLDGDNKYKVEEYDTRIPILRRSSIYKTSEYLIVHLKRFDFCYQTFTKKKLTDYFEFPFLLDLSEYTHSKVLSKDKRGFFDTKQVEIEEQPAENFKYNLKGIVIHSGTTEGGHYYSIIKENGKWWKCDDNRITEFKEENIPSESFGGESSLYENLPSAYMLFYTRNEETEVKFNQETLSKIDIHNRNFKESKIKTEPELLQFLADLSRTTGKLNNEISPLTKLERTYMQITEVYNQSSMDNFTSELFDELYANSMNLKENKDRSDAYKTGKLIIKYFLNVAVPIFPSAKITLLASSISVLLKNSPGLCTWFIKYVIRNRSNLFFKLVKNTPDIREATKYVLTEVFDTLYIVEKKHILADFQVIYKDTENKFAFMFINPSASGKFLVLVLNEYLEYSRDLWKDNYQLTNTIKHIFSYFEYTNLAIRYNYVLILMKFVANNQMTELVTKFQTVITHASFATFSNILELLSILVCSTVTEGIMKGQKFSVHSLFQQDEKIYLEETTSQLLNSQNFLVGIIAKHYADSHSCSIIQHLHWMNLEQSKVTIETILEEMKRNYTLENEWNNLLFALKNLMHINDGFEEVRVALILGNGEKSGLIKLLADALEEKKNIYFNMVYLLKLGEFINYELAKNYLVENKESIEGGLLKKVSEFLQDEEVTNRLKKFEDIMGYNTTIMMMDIRAKVAW